MKRIVLLLATILLLFSGCSPKVQSNVATSAVASPFASAVVISEKDYPDTYQEVWGDLEKHEGGAVWGTLTSDQQSYVNYPKFDKNLVYWTPGGKSYHAIDWCYTLEKSETIVSGAFGDAIEAGKTDPCSKCVGDR